MTTMTLDRMVSQAVHQAHALERAVHDTGTWTISLGNQNVPAERILLPTGVMFTAWFEPTTESVAQLEIDGQVVLVRNVESDTDGDFGLQWYIEAEQVVPAR